MDKKKCIGMKKWICIKKCWKKCNCKKIALKGKRVGMVGKRRFVQKNVFLGKSAFVEKIYWQGKPDLSKTCIGWKKLNCTKKYMKRKERLVRKTGLIKKSGWVGKNGFVEKMYLLEKLKL